MILKEMAVGADVALVAPVEPRGVSVWSSRRAWLRRVVPWTLLRASGLSGWRWRLGRLGAGDGVRCFAALSMTDGGRR